MAPHEQERPGTGARLVRFEVQTEDAGLRLDQLVARRVPELSRRKARLLIELGGLFVDRVRVKVLGRRLRPGQIVEVHLGGALERASPTLGARARARDEARLPTFEIRHEDADVVVVEKPSGLLTAPTPESDRNNLADLLARRPGHTGRIWVVHRLDLETSGLLVFAKTPAANRALAERFRLHDVEREYLAVAEGEVTCAPGRLDEPIAGRSAVSHVTLLGVGSGRSLLRIRLETGRTHQVRLHLRGIGHPVCGDRRYGRNAAPAPPRLALHATRLGFAQPTSGALLRFESPWPADLGAWLAAAGFAADSAGSTRPIC